MVEFRDEWVSSLFDSGYADVRLFLEKCLENAQMEKMDSPIEQVFMMAFKAITLLWMSDHQFHTFTAKPRTLDRCFEIISGYQKKSGGVDMGLFPQVAIEPYRVDFVLVQAKGREGLGGIVVECDGHQFHERTPEQAAHDRKRDRVLQMQGLMVFRYTGSEIWRDPFKCAREVFCEAVRISVETIELRHREGEVAQCAGC